MTLTFATSLDSSLSLAPGVRTRLSGPHSKAMTHHLRSRHDAILIGINTLLADSPALNCRISGAARQPRPIIIDPHARWTPDPSDRVLETARLGNGQAPFVLTGVEAQSLPAVSIAILEQHGGKYVHIPVTPDVEGKMRFDWHTVFDVLHQQAISSIMVEGGGQIINSLLAPGYHELVDSVIVTVAPTWLGQGGVVVSPSRLQDSAGEPVPAARLHDVTWLPFGEDVVLCGRLHA